MGGNVTLISSDTCLLKFRAGAAWREVTTQCVSLSLSNSSPLLVEFGRKLGKSLYMSPRLQNHSAHIQPDDVRSTVAQVAGTAQKLPHEVHLVWSQKPKPVKPKFKFKYKIVSNIC